MALLVETFMLRRYLSTGRHANLALFVELGFVLDL